MTSGVGEGTNGAGAVNEERQHMKEVGARMKEAAKAAGLDAAAIAAEMGVALQSIYNWWKGTREPGLLKLSRYADIVGREVGWFFDPNGKHTAQVDDTMMRIIRLGMEGLDLLQAYEMVTKGDGALTRREREVVAAGSEMFRSELTRRAGKPLDQLTEEERSHLGRALLDEALRPGGK